MEYILRRHPRARKVKLTVHADGRVVLTVPRRASVARAEEFLRSKMDWVKDRLAWWATQPHRPSKEDRRAEYLAYKERARKIAHERVAYFAAVYGVAVRKISIRNQASRWGSCSRKGNVNLNYRIALVPPELADYVIVHEICHLLEFNHSPRFWGHVAKTVPNHEHMRRALARF